MRRWSWHELLNKEQNGRFLEADANKIDLKFWHEDEQKAEQKKQRALRKTPFILAIAILGSVILHILVYPLISRLPNATVLAPSKNEKISARLIEKPKAKLAEQLDKQVVTTAPPEKQKRPIKARYLSNYDQEYSKETIASKTSPYSKVISSKPKSIEKEVKKEKVEHKPLKEMQAKNFEKNEPNEPKDQGDLKPIKRGQKKTPNNKKFMPSFSELAEAAGMPFNDYVQDVEVGQETKLNTWQWDHATFFFRIKEAVARTWAPNEQIHKHDPRGLLLGKRDRMTHVRVTINKKGEVTKVGVEKASGVGYLDAEALHAFELAAPFPNPPEALFDASGLFSFNFGFYLSYERGFSMGF